MIAGRPSGMGAGRQKNASSINAGTATEDRSSLSSSKRMVNNSSPGIYNPIMGVLKDPHS